jgi:uncharacterized protein
MRYFEWDATKAAENLRKHGISFEAASASLEDPYGVEEEDLTDDGEQRLRTTGIADGQTIVMVIHLDRSEAGSQDQVTRIISARKATRMERRVYEQYGAKSGGNAFE